MARRRTAPPSWSMISFRKPVPTFRDHARILLVLIAVTAGVSAARAADCLAGPNAPSPAGSHWFYRIDHATHRKCWYLGDANRRRASAAQTQAARRSVAEPPEPPEEAPAPPQVPPRETAPDPAFGTRWPQAAATPGLVAPGATIAAAPRGEPERLPAPPAALTERIGTRVVTTERVHNEPAPAKAQQPIKPQAAAPVAAAATDARGGLPAALLGIALLLAAVGTMLVLARRRLMTGRDVYVGRGPDESATQHSWRARRGLREILAHAAEGEPDGAEHQTRFFDRIWRGLDESDPDGSLHLPSGHLVPGVMRATRDEATPDIAAATLQPTIEALPPEPIEAPPDVEQSLRQLLAAWERRAA
jgi:hypothetical protein